MSIFNPVIVAILLILGLMLTPASGSDETTLTLGEKHDDEIGGEEKPTHGVTALGVISTNGVLPGGVISTIGIPGRGYQADLTVKLKVGQTVLISADALNDNRKIYVILRDRTGLPVGVSKPESGSSRVKIKVASNGNHTINVVSNRVGNFTLLVTTDDELSEKELEKKIEILEKELKELKAKLKEKQDKKPEK